MKKGLLFASLTILAVSAGFLVKNENVKHSKDYQSRVVSKKTPHSNHEERQKYYEILLANSKTGKIEPQDRLDSWEAMKKYSFHENKSLSMTFVDRGPDNIGGRTRAIGINRSNDDIMYAGSVSGGLFWSTDRGANWSRVESWDAQVGVLCISSIETTSDGTVYVATGGSQFEGGLTGGGSGAQAGANGVYYCIPDPVTNELLNWTSLPGTSGSIMQIWRDPSQSDKIYIGGSTCLVSSDKMIGASAISGVTGNGYDLKASGDGSIVFICARVGGSFRYYLSTDFGGSFTEVPAGNLPTAIGRAECTVTDVKNENGFYNIYVSASTGGGQLHSVRLSEDHGVTWTNIGPGGSPAFSPFSTSLSSQGNYDQTISYWPGFPDICVLGGIDQYQWTKTPGSSPTFGGWQQISLWSAHPSSPNYIHADNHEMKFNSIGQYFYGNDGGVGSQNFAFYPSNRGYNVTQFYSVAHDRNGAVMGGAQDNGTLYNDYTLSSTQQFREVMGGDGFDCDISHYDPDAMFATVYNSSISRSEDGGNNWQEIEPPCSGVIGESCGVFHTPLRFFEDPNDMDSQDYIEFYPTDSTIPAGTTVTYYSNSYNSSVPENVLTHTLTTDLYFADTLFSDGTLTSGDYYALHPGTSDTILMGGDIYKVNYPLDTVLLQDRVQTMLVTLANTSVYQVLMTRDAARFGLLPDWWDLTSGSSFNSVPLCFEFSWDGNIVYVGTYDGLWRIKGLDSVYAATDIATSIQVDKIYSSPTRPVNGIAIDKNNPERLILARSETGGNSLVELDNCESGGTATLVSTSVQGNIPTSMAILDVIIDYRDPQKLVCGSDFGPWASSDGGSSWTQCINETGPVPVFAVRQQQRGWQESSRAGEIYLGTHGRGMWTSGSILSDESAEHLNFNSDTLATGLSVYPNPLDEAGSLSFVLNQRTDVTINIYSVNGKLVKTINNSNMATGKHLIDLDMSGEGKGTYIVQLEAGNTSDVTRFIKLK